MKNTKIQMLVEGAIMVALATALSFVKVFQLPWGGSITLVSMLPIVIYSIKWGIKAGLATALVYSLVQLGQGIVMDGLLGWGLSPAALIGCIMLDYILAFSVLGLAGAFRKKGMVGWIGGMVMAIVIRYALHVTSGVVIFASVGLLWEGFETDNSIIYSSVYNGAFMLPEMVFTIIAAVVLLSVPVIKTFVRPQKTIAAEKAA